MEEQGNRLDDKVSLEQFAEMAGFPVELVKQELLDGVDSDDQISVEALREFMLKYLDKTMMDTAP